MPKAKIVTTVELKDPEGQWVNEEFVTFNSAEALQTFVMQRIAKIHGEGGILEMMGDFEARFVTRNRIKSIHAKGTIVIEDTPPADEVETPPATPTNVTPFRRVH